jgi:hypothetical protein
MANSTIFLCCDTLRQTLCSWFASGFTQQRAGKKSRQIKNERNITADAATTASAAGAARVTPS